MIKRLLCFAASLAAVITATAGPVSPRQAMTRLTGSAAIRSTGTQAPTSLRLAELNPLQADSCHALYIFTDETGGYYIAPTDDNAPALLGYGKGLDPQDIPSNMLAWLAGYSRQVEWLAANPQAAAPKAAVHAEIAPLVTTKWNQSAPYYNQCPMHNGKRSVTGCVATAMAQLINYNEWPKGNGYGTHSYAWNGQTLTFNYGATSFNWNLMLDKYTASSPAANNNAVASLMYACGVSVDMNYSSSESGAATFRCATALINNFGYDQGTGYYMRDYFTTDDWDTIIYGELAAGRPVLYDGQSTTGGHAFVCDGYRNGYYHINWGWGGMSDNYFLLSALDPNSQGIGGSSSGYNFNQAATIGIQPPVDGSVRFLPFYAHAGITYDSENHWIWFGRNANNEVNGAFNYTANEIEIVAGLKLVAADGTVYYADGSVTNKLNPLAGIAVIYPVMPTSLPAGTYKAYPVVRYSDADTWFPIRIPLDKNQYLTVRKGQNDYITYDGSDPDAVKASFKITSLRQRGAYWTKGEKAIFDYNLTDLTGSDLKAGMKICLQNNATGTITTIGTWTIEIGANKTAARASQFDCTLPDGTYTGWLTDVCGLKVSNEATFYVGSTSAIEIVGADGEDAAVDVYSMQGILLRKAVPASEATQGLPAGLYIVGGKKVLVH